MSEEKNDNGKGLWCIAVFAGLLVILFALYIYYIYRWMIINKSADIRVGVILFISFIISLMVWYYGIVLACLIGISQGSGKIKTRCITLVALELFALVLIFPEYFILFAVIFTICFFNYINYRGEKIVKVIGGKICLVAKHILKIMSEGFINLLLIGAILVLYILEIYELISEFFMILSKFTTSILLILSISAILVAVFLALTKFFYMEPECWWKRIWATIEEWLSISENSFDKLLLWFAAFLILFVFVFSGVIILYYKYNSGYKFLINLITNKDLFEWTFNLFLFTFFALIISIFSQLFFRANDNTKSAEDSEFLFYMLSVKALVILSIALIIAYALTRTFILNIIPHPINLYRNRLLPCCIDKYMACVNSVGNSSMSVISIIIISVYYALFGLVFYYFLKKFLEVIKFAMPVHRLQTKIKVLSHSPLNKGTLKLWNAFWRSEKFDDALSEGASLANFILKIIYHTKFKLKEEVKFFQLKEQVSVATDALRGFSESISSRHPEALAMEVLNIAPRRLTQPKRLPVYLTDVLKSYKDIVCEDRLICEEPDSLALLYKQYFKEEAYKSESKYQYLDELIYQLLVTIRKSIEKLQEGGYFKRDKNRCRALYCKFKDIVGVLCDFKCSGKDNDRLKNALNAESAKKWIEEAGNLFKIIDNVDCIPQTLYIPVEKAVRMLKNGEINADVLRETFDKWNSVCAQSSTKS